MAYEDQNAEKTYEEADEDMKLKPFFGEVQRVLEIRMPKARELGIKKPETVVFVEIQSCDMEPTRAPGKLRGVDIWLYPGMEDGTEIIDLTTVQCLVGRIRWDGWWAVFDRSGAAKRITNV
jgi:hypothetical protein